ncbi:MAG: MBL fold metallo-hydrolase [Candidatus Kerfeldbacteria bacterium]|nr:MBL fold metallo-hydrolase [Candidatus Kerfeldbacteria bacterium]
MKLTFCGASREVTGSCYVLETATKKMVIDCGLFQGQRIAEQQNFEDFPFDPASIDVLFITHAHLDHCGRIPKLVRDGFRGRIIATKPTARLAQLILEDSVDILEHEARRHQHEPIFSLEDFEQTVTQFEETSYRTPITLDSDTTVEFFDAGHILGSSSIRITAEGKSIVFSGDLGNCPAPILNSTDMIGEADYIVMESTYGGRTHEDKKTRTLLLQSAIYEIATMKGVLMIPAFAMERTQELLFELNNLTNNKDIPPVPIFLDSPLAIKATEVFRDSIEYFNLETQEIIRKGDDIFQFPNLHNTLTPQESKKIHDIPAPKIIIAGSGMAQGGRIVHHIEDYISFFANQYLIVGFQVNGSLGRRLLEGKKEISVNGKPFPVKAKVRAIGAYSAHADQNALLKWVGGFNQKQLRKIFITHGEEEQAEILAGNIRQVVQADVSIPELFSSVDL